MAENKNQISAQEWSRRMRSGGRQAAAPSSIRRTPSNTSGPLAQLRSNLTNLNKQKLGLALGNIKGQYNLADQIARGTAEINAAAIARKEQLFANRQANLERMAQLYGQYYQQFGNTLNKEALAFLDDHANINVPTLTAIMAGYEHARASQAEQQLAMLDRQAKMVDAEAQLAEKQVALENEKAANDQYVNMQRLEAQSKANQAAYEAQKAYFDEQAKNELISAGLTTGGRGGGVRALPGVGGGARAGVSSGRIPGAVIGARGGETAGGAAPVARVVQTADGQTIAVDNNNNLIGSVATDGNGNSVVVNDNGQTVGSVDANGNVIPAQQGLYAQYLAAGGGGFWSHPFSSAWNALGFGGDSNLLGTAGTYSLGSEATRLWKNRRDAKALDALGYINPNSAEAARLRYQIADRNALRWTSRVGTLAGKVVPTLAQKGLTLGSRALGWASIVPAGLNLLGNVAGTVAGLGQTAFNMYQDTFGNRDEEIQNALMRGEPIPKRISGIERYNMVNDASDRFFGFFNNNRDVQNFERFYNNIAGTSPTLRTKSDFDKQNPVVRVQILDKMLSGDIKNEADIFNLIKDTINTYSNPQEQQAIQQQIQDENDQAVFNKSISSTTGDNLLVEAVTKELGNRLAKLGYNFDYEDLARFGNAYTNMVSWIETRNKAGAGNNTTSATSMYQITKDFFDNQKKYILNNFHDTLPAEQKDRLIKATSARDLDNDLDRPILQAMVLANVYNNLGVNNQHFDKQGPNIRSDQMAGDVISMMKDAYEAGQFDENGELFLDPVLGGNLARIWGVNFFRGIDSKAVRDAYNNVNNAFNEAWGFRRDAQGNNLPWWNGGWELPQRYREMLGMSGAQQQTEYGFDVAPGVDVDNLNTLLIHRFSAANDAMVAATGVKGRVNSGKRSVAKQTELYRNKANNPNPVGRPGYSFHQSGMALDFNNDEWEKTFNGSDQLKHNYGTFDNFLNSFGLQRGVTDKNGKRSDLVHLTMLQDDEYHAYIDHDRLMASRGKWGDEHGNYWMRGVGQGRQVQPAWDMSPQFMVENFGYPFVEQIPTEYDPNVIFAGYDDGYDDGYGQDGVVFDYDEYGYPTF